MSKKTPGPAVLLINPNRIRPAIGPIGLELLADGLARRGYKPILLDLAWERAPIKAIRRALGRDKPIAVGIGVRNLDDCYFASRAFLLPPLRRYVQAVREVSDCPVVLCGVGFSVAPGAALSYLGADYGIRGDGEDSLPDLLEKIIHGEDPDGVPGLVRPGGEEPAPAAAKGFAQSSPRRETADLARYFKFGGQGAIETQRGCDRRCIYCADPVAKGRRPRYRDPEAVADEMARLCGIGVNILHLCDSEFNLSRGRGPSHHKGRARR